MPVDASIHFRGEAPKLGHTLHSKIDDRGSFAVLTIGDGHGSQLAVFADSPDVLWQIASAAGAAAGMLARQLRADEAAEKALNDTDPVPPPVVAYELGGEGG